MQTEAEAFLQRIRAFPDDDAPRLIFADWLDERGDPRGRFIRVQLALAHHDEEPAGSFDRETTRAELVHAERELLDAHREEWTVPFRGLATGLRFRRGFVEEVNVTARQLLSRAHELFDTGPIRHIHLIEGGSALPAVFQCNLLSRLNALTVQNLYGGEPLARAVARSPHLGGLKVLHLTRNRLEADAAAHLATSPVLANLEELDLSENELGETGARALAASAHLGGLRRLEMRVNHLGPAGAEVIAGSERLANLHRLGLSENEISSPRLQSPGLSNALSRIPVLNLATNGLNPPGLQVILGQRTEPRSVRTQELDLSHNELGDDGARVIAASPLLDGVKVLRLVGCGIDDAGGRWLAGSEHLKRLVELDLSNNPIGNAGFRWFLESLHLRSLRRLIPPTHDISADMRRALDERFHRGRG